MRPGQPCGQVPYAGNICITVERESITLTSPVLGVELLNVMVSFTTPRVSFNVPDVG